MKPRVKESASLTYRSWLKYLYDFSDADWAGDIELWNDYFATQMKPRVKESASLTYRSWLKYLYDFSDADWAGDIDNRNSTSGYIFLLCAWWRNLMEKPEIETCCIVNCWIEIRCYGYSAAQESIWLRQLILVHWLFSMQLYHQHENWTYTELWNARDIG